MKLKSKSFKPICIVLFILGGIFIFLYYRGVRKGYFDKREGFFDGKQFGTQFVSGNWTNMCDLKQANSLVNNVLTANCGNPRFPSKLNITDCAESNVTTDTTGITEKKGTLLCQRYKKRTAYRKF
jgi:hypothetical protein